MIIVWILILLVSCSDSYYNDEEIEEEDDSTEDVYGYKDGIYCAEVEYYYSKTGTKSNYTLHVEIYNNDLIKIFWPNGGWLDNSHFNPQSISSGKVDFSSFEGVDYTVTIVGEEGDCYVSRNAESEYEIIDRYDRYLEEQEGIEERRQNDDYYEEEPEEFEEFE